MAETNDGFEIARATWRSAGPGEFMGARQSGDALLRFADLAEDGRTAAKARAVTPELLQEHPAGCARRMSHAGSASRADYLKA
jgi:ATP-dependent DNA helicase RecG